MRSNQRSWHFFTAVLGGILFLCPGAAPAMAAPPTIHPILDQTMNEDSVKVVPFTIGDADTPLSSLAVTVSTSNAILLPASRVILGGTAATRTATLKPAVNRSGLASVAIRVSDGVAAASATFVLSVKPVNDAPVFAGAYPNRCAAGSTYDITVTTLDPDPGDTRTLSCSAKPAWLTFTVTGNGTGRLLGTPTADDAGFHTVGLTVVDRAGASACRSILIIVTAPTATPPRFSPEGSAYRDPVQVSITSTTPGVSIRYTTDGTVPTSGTGLPYTAPLTISSRLTLTAVACKDGMKTSPPTRATYSIAPEAATGGVIDLGPDTATVSGSLNPRGLTASAWFEWGLDASFTTFSVTPSAAFGPLTDPQPTTALLSGLQPGSTYYYRLVVRNAAGTVRGTTDWFTMQYQSFDSILVNSTGDELDPPLGKMTLRAAVDLVNDGGSVIVDPVLTGTTINLTTIGARHSILKGETFTFAPGSGWVFGGFRLRDYGRSAIYAAKSISIDASGLAEGITFRWAGAEPARILAVWGSLTMNNVTVVGGQAVSEATTAPVPADPAQPFTLARGGGIAVWGTAILEKCTFGGNRVEGDTSPSRDRGAFGGAIYADAVLMTDSIVSGNSVIGFGAAGGGIYSVSGAESGYYSLLERSTISGNRVTGQHAYGGGVYSDGGGPGSMNSMTLCNCTVARNLVEDNPYLSQSAMMQYYYRGGGIYMSNGYLVLTGSTVAENRVTGVAATFSGKPNMGGGGIAATIGNAHVVEDMRIWQSILVGNTLNGVAEDIFTGSLLDFYSYGYNRIGVIDFSYILVPVPPWWCLSRRHYPKVGDVENVTIDQVLDRGAAVYHGSIISTGADEGGPALLWYPPAGQALDQVPPKTYGIPYVWGGYSLLDPDVPDDFANLILADLRAKYPDILGSDFGLEFGDLTGLTFYADAFVWPADPRNAPWIKFWRDLDAAIGERFGAVRLGDAYWGTFPGGYNLFGENIEMSIFNFSNTLPYLNGVDQLNRPRFVGGMGDVGAIETP